MTSLLRRQLVPRLLAYRHIKVIGMAIFMGAFFTGYFQLLHHPRFAVTVMPLTWIDRATSFWPGALPLYASLWFYVLFPPALLPDRRAIARYTVAAASLCLLGMAVFFLWPTAVPPADIDLSRHPSFASLQAVDKSGNACPSLHAAFAVFTAVVLDRLLRQMGARILVRGLNVLWCVGILYSTLATKQHVAVDVLAGVALAAGVCSVYRTSALGSLPSPVAAREAIPSAALFRRSEGEIEPGRTD